MKVVIADTPPLNYLILVDAVDVLPRLYGQLTIPDVVWTELTSENSPREVTDWTAVLPQWIHIQ